MTILALIAIAGMTAWFMRHQLWVGPDPQHVFKFHADRNVMAGTELEVRQHGDGFVVSAFVGIQQNRGGWNRIRVTQARAICGALLTYATSKQIISDRDAVYRVEFTVNGGGFGRSRNREHDHSFPVSVRDGACDAFKRSDLNRLSMPGPLRNWDIVGLVYDDDDRSVKVTFDPASGGDFKGLIGAFDPLVACTTALAERFKGAGTPLDRTRFEKLVVEVRNLRGNALLNYYTSRSWNFDVAGDVCFHENGVPG